MILKSDLNKIGHTRLYLYTSFYLYFLRLILRNTSKTLVKNSEQEMRELCLCMKLITNISFFSYLPRGK